MTDIAKRVPVYLGEKIAGIGYVSEDESFLVIKMDEMKTLSKAFEPDSVQAFFLGVHYKPDKKVG